MSLTSSRYRRSLALLPPLKATLCHIRYLPETNDIAAAQTMRERVEGTAKLNTGVALPVVSGTGPTSWTLCVFQRCGQWKHLGSQSRIDLYYTVQEEAKTIFANVIDLSGETETTERLAVVVLSGSHQAEPTCSKEVCRRLSTLTSGYVLRVPAQGSNRLPEQGTRNDPTHDG